MNEVLKVIECRRSCRKYKAELPPMELLQKIAEAGTYAPTGKNTQSPIIMVITNRELRDKLSAMNAKILGVSGDPFYGAPCLMLVLADSIYSNYIQDGSLVMGNLMLAAESVGLGSCWINRAREEFESPEGKQMLKAWGLSESFAGIGHCILGWPMEEARKAAPRKPDYIRWLE